jgi:hypothetical protein
VGRGGGGVVVGEARAESIYLKTGVIFWFFFFFSLPELWLEPF